MASQYVSTERPAILDMLTPSATPTPSSTNAIPQQYSINEPIANPAGYTADFMVDYVGATWRSDITTSAPGYTSLSRGAGDYVQVENTTTGRTNPMRVAVVLTSAYPIDSPACSTALQRNLNWTFTNDTRCFISQGQYVMSTGDLVVDEFQTLALTDGTVAKFEDVPEESADSVLASLNAPLGYAVLAFDSDLHPKLCGTTGSVGESNPVAYQTSPEVCG
ncbi:hypothetical protein C5C50_04220 [Rathayibacter sp. AY1D9]|nr:hypothetical protein C5C50_04220 [Rathayibacter sp. AY1D9]